MYRFAYDALPRFLFTHFTAATTGAAGEWHAVCGTGGAAGRGATDSRQARFPARVALNSTVPQTPNDIKRI